MTVGDKTRTFAYPNNLQIVLDYDRYTWVLKTKMEQGMVQNVHKIGKSWNGANNTNWKVDLAQGKDVTNRYEYTLYHPATSMSAAEIHFQKNVFNSSTNRVIHYYRLNPPSLLGTYTAIDLNLRHRLTQEAMGKFYRKLVAESQAINGWSFLGELANTIHSLRHPAESLAKLVETYAKNVELNKRQFSRRKETLLRSVMRAQKKRARMNRLIAQERKLASNLWLEFQFGLKPLAGDIAAAAGAVYDYSTGNDRLNYKVVYAKAEASDERSTNGSVGSHLDVRYEETNLYVRATKVKLQGIINMEAHFAGVTPARVLRNKFDLGFSAVAPAVWDLLPCSVFFDYFANINDVITAATAVVPKVANMNRRVRETVTLHHSYDPTNHTLGYPKIDPPKRRGTCSVSKTHYLRERYALSIPELTFTTPFDSPIRLTNLAAFLNNVI